MERAPVDNLGRSVSMSTRAVLVSSLGVPEAVVMLVGTLGLFEGGCLHKAPLDYAIGGRNL